MRSVSAYCAAVLAVAALARGQDRAATADVGQWVNISDPVVAQLAAAGTKIPWPGQTAGVCVDPASGRVYMDVSGVGLWRSDDHGQTFARVAEGKVGGRAAVAYSMSVDPAGSRLACFMLEGKGGMTLDGGRSWHSFADVGRNWDFAAVDWSDPQARRIFAHRHESGGEMYLSDNAGETWQLVGKHPEFTAVGVAGARALLGGTAEGIERSTDDGRRWTKISDLHPVGRATVPFKGAVYWLAREGLIATRDDGLTWVKVCATNDAGWGPIFGGDEQHMVVADFKGISRTTDGGRTWERVAPFPPIKTFAPTQPGEYLSIGWDAAADILYASCLSNPTYRMRLK